MPGGNDVARFVRGVPNERSEVLYLLELSGLLDTPLPARHLIRAGEKVYEGSRQAYPGQGFVPVV